MPVSTLTPRAAEIKSDTLHRNFHLRCLSLIRPREHRVPRTSYPDPPALAGMIAHLSRRAWAAIRWHSHIWLIDDWISVCLKGALIAEGAGDSVVLLVQCGSHEVGLLG